VLASAGHACTLWCADEATALAIGSHRRHPTLLQGRALSDRLRATAGLQDAVQGAELVVVAVAAGAAPGRGRPPPGPGARALRGLGPGDAVVLSATKGLDPATGRRMSELLADAGGGAVGAISGPNITHEMMDERLTCLVVASASPAARTLAGRLFTAPW